MKLSIIHLLPALVNLTGKVRSAPPGFPATGNGLWYTKPGSVWSKELLPIGNGYLAAMVSGGTFKEVTQLNIESLWSGGPFEDPGYNGGNKQPSEREVTAKTMQDIRQAIFTSPTGQVDNITSLTTDAGAYGSYAGAGYLITTTGSDSSGAVSNYARWLDMDQGVVRSSWTQSGVTFKRESFCSHPTRSCTQKTVLGSPAVTLTYAFSSSLESGLPAPNITCLDSSTLRVRGLAGTPGMLYEILGNVRSNGGRVVCAQYPVPFGAPFNASISVNEASEAWISWVGDTEYSMDAGNSAHGFSFKGADPHATLLTLLSAINSSSGASYASLLSRHTDDFKRTISGNFALSLGQSAQLDITTDVLKSGYQIDVGNPYLEWVLFNYGRYLLVSSSRGMLPANLQGKWANGYGNAWSADYHSNINIQMNYWGAENTGLDVVRPLFDYIEKTWAPRGQLTAQVLYNISQGWVTHNEMNTFGHTGMKAYGNSAEWANYPESAVWMMLHVWDHFDYTNDISWWRSQGWPLIKGVAKFHLNKLIPDNHFNDGTLVVNPCNSPEQAPITFGCAHAQQLIWQLFNAVERGFASSGDTDSVFLQEVKDKRRQMDKGLKIGSWGQLQEWKVDLDSPDDTHRHLSHLIGLYPGYAIASYDPALQMVGYSRNQITAATKTSLIHRGNGTGPDADSGWEKVWRAACWAQLGDSGQFYHELSYSIFENFGPNLFSLYNPFDADPIFQIDANLGYLGAVMNALIQAPDVPRTESPLIISILPALPRQWSAGSLKGARVRGGMSVNMQWENSALKALVLSVSQQQAAKRNVQVVYRGKVLRSFQTSPGLEIAVDTF